jgi:hypothetical protein
MQLDMQATACYSWALVPTTTTKWRYYSYSLIVLPWPPRKWETSRPSSPQQWLVNRVCFQLSEQQHDARNSTHQDSMAWWVQISSTYVAAQLPWFVHPATYLYFPFMLRLSTSNRGTSHVYKGVVPGTRWIGFFSHLAPISISDCWSPWRRFTNSVGMLGWQIMLQSTTLYSDSW